MMLKLLNSFYHDRAGSIAIEYAVVGALVSMGILIGLTNFTNAFGNIINIVSDRVNATTLR